MKNLKLAILVIVFSLSCFGVVVYFSIPNTDGAASVDLLDKMENDSVMDFEMTDVYGKKFKLSDYKGKVIILSFWASWCDPCVEEFPSMLRLIEKFSGEVIMVAISKDYEEAEILKFLKVFKAKSPNLVVAWDNAETGKISELYQVAALPESFVIGRDFKLKRKVPGSENWATEQAYEFFEMLLAE